MEIPDTPHTHPERGHLREGLRYAASTPHARALLLLVGATSMFGLSYAALMPLFAASVLHGDARTLGALLGAVGVGALAAAVSLLRRQGLSGLGRRTAWGATVLAVGLLGLAGSRWVIVSQLALFLVGVGFMSQMVSTNTLLQSLAPATLRGRVMGLYSTLFIGMTPIGSLLAGALAAHFGAPVTVAGGAIVVLCASVAFHLALPALRRVVVRDYPAFFPPDVS